jgi:hypothetical protein
MRLVSTLQPATRVQFREGASNWVDTPFLQATTFEHEHESRTPNAMRLVRAGRRVNVFLELKPQAESLRPFGTKAGQTHHRITFRA